MLVPSYVFNCHFRDGKGLDSSPESTTDDSDPLAAWKQEAGSDQGSMQVTLCSGCRNCPLQMRALFRNLATDAPEALTWAVHISSKSHTGNLYQKPHVKPTFVCQHIIQLTGADIPMTMAFELWQSACQMECTTNENSIRLPAHLCSVANLAKNSGVNNVMLQDSEPPDSGRREIQMAEINEDSLDGELPFLPRDASEDGGQRRSSVGGLPTHEPPPSRGFLARRYSCLLLSLITHLQKLPVISEEGGQRRSSASGLPTHEPPSNRGSWPEGTAFCFPFRVQMRIRTTHPKFVAFRPT